VTNARTGLRTETAQPLEFIPQSCEHRRTTYSIPLSRTCCDHL